MSVTVMPSGTPSGSSVERRRLKDEWLTFAELILHLHATGYWLLATGYWLLATGHWLLASLLQDQLKLRPHHELVLLAREDALRCLRRGGPVRQVGDVQA